MTLRSLACLMVGAAGRLLPERRGAWAAAMRAEVDQISNDGEAAGFALGCLWTAISERIQAMKLFTLVGRGGVAIVTVLYALMWLWAASNGVRMMAGGEDAYIAGVAHSYDAVDAIVLFGRMPLGMIFGLVTGAAYGAAAVFLVRWRPRPFFISCCVVQAASLLYNGPGMIAGSHSAWERLVLYLIPLLMLAGAGLVLSWLDKREPPLRPAGA